MDQVQPQPTTTPVPSIVPTVQPPQSKSKVWLWIVGGILLLGVGMVGGVFLGKQLYSKPVPQPTPSPIAEAASTPDPTANWKTYTNNKFRFDVKYPPSWKYLEVPNNTYETKNNEIWFTHGDFPPPNIGARADIVFIITSFDPSADWEPKYFDNYRSIAYQLDNITAKKITGINKEGLNQEFVIIARIGNYYLQVMPNQSEESLKYLDQILSTFKFLGQTSDVSNWKTYSNPQYNLEFKYPSTWLISSNTNAFQGGDIVGIGIQNCCGITISKPIKTDSSIENYVSLYINSASQQSDGVQRQNTIKTINNEVAVESKPIICAGRCFVYTYFKHNGSMYGILSSTSDETLYSNYSEVFDQILSTFKFTN